MINLQRTQRHQATGTTFKFGMLSMIATALCAMPAVAQVRCDRPDVNDRSRPITVAAPDRLEVVYLIKASCSRRLGGSNVTLSRLGLADSRGKILVPAVYSHVLPLSTTHALVQPPTSETNPVTQRRIYSVGRGEGPPITDWTFPVIPNNVWSPSTAFIPAVIAQQPRRSSDSTTFNLGIYSSRTSEARIIPNVGGKAVFGSDRFDASINGGFSNFDRVAARAFQRIGNQLIIHSTASDGTWTSQIFNLNGDPLTPVMGQISVRYFSDPARINRPELITRIGDAPAGLGLSEGLYLPLTLEGALVTPPDGILGYSPVYTGQRTSYPLWVAVGRQGVAVLGGLLEDAVARIAISPLPADDWSTRIEQFRGYIGGPRADGQWVLRHPGGSMAAQFTPPQANAQNLWTAALREAESRSAKAREAYREQEAARAAAERVQSQHVFDTWVRTNQLCTNGGSLANALGGSSLVTYFERCGLPSYEVDNARRAGMSAQAITAATALYEKDLLRRQEAYAAENIGKQTASAINSWTGAAAASTGPSALDQAMSLHARQYRENLDAYNRGAHNWAPLGPSPR